MAAIAGSGAPAGIRRWLGAGEHEQVLGKLSRGLMWAMGGRWRLPVAHRTGGAGGGGDRGSGVGETAEEPGEWFAGVLLVLMRVKDKALGFCSKLSTAAARWWLAVVF
jgi:hypothetical protein